MILERFFLRRSISGKITDIHLEGNNIVQIFGEPKKYPWIKVPAQNYMAYRGNKLQFGKLLMSDTDLVLIDPAPKDPFDFYLDRYKDQLVAGYSKTTPTFGLDVYMVDFNKLKKASVPLKRPKRPKRRNKRAFSWPQIAGSRQNCSQVRPHQHHMRYRSVAHKDAGLCGPHCPKLVSVQAALPAVTLCMVDVSTSKVRTRGVPSIWLLIVSVTLLNRSR